MEEKIIKSSVFVNETVFNETCEQPIDVDFTLPDFCADISKIFKCRAVSHISSKSLGGKVITIDGSVCITVIYCDENGKLCSYEYQYPFSKNLEMNEEASGANLTCHSKCDYINCRAVTGRKVDIHGAVSITVRVFKRKSTDIVSDIDDCNIEQRRGTAPATVPMGYSEKYITVEEDIGIGQGQPQIGRILRYDAKPCVRESKIINDKIVVKGDISVWILYSPDGEGAEQCVKTVIPFSQIMDMEGVTDSCECDTGADVAFLEIKPRNTDDGAKCFAFSAKLLITSEAYCGNDVAVLLDAFSRKFAADFKRERICFNKICDNISEIFHCKKNIELDEPISSVIDLWCDIQSSSVKFEDGSMIINGTVLASVISCGSGGETLYFEKPIDFEYKYMLKGNTEGLHCTPEISISSCGYTIMSAETVELRIDLSINAAIYSSNNMPLITDVTVDENTPGVQNAKCAMTIYFTADGECVWDIAKHYNASVEEIMKINELDEECLPEGKMLLIPAI